jgi:hypothetical protein
MGVNEVVVSIDLAASTVSVQKTTKFFATKSSFSSKLPATDPENPFPKDLK